MSATNDTTKLVEEASKYKYGFTTNIEQELAPKGLDKQIVKFISGKKDEPRWLLDWRLKAFESLEKREEKLPSWANLKYEKIDISSFFDTFTLTYTCKYFILKTHKRASNLDRQMH